MRRHKLLNLLTANRFRGLFRAETTADGDEAGENVIYLYDVIVASESDAQWWGGVSAEALVKAFAGMSGPVALHINSPGGDVFAGQAMANAIKAYPGAVTAYVDGYAASAASTVAIACDKVVMGSGAMFMIHKAWTFEMGNADDLMATANLLNKIDANLAEAYAAKSGKTVDEVMALLNAGDTWFSAQETVDYGLADEIATAAPKSQSKIEWDLSAYDQKSKKDAEVETPPENKAPVAVTETDAERERRQRVHRMRMAKIA